MNGKRSHPLRSGLLGPWRTRPDRHIVPRHVKVGWKINCRQTALAGVRPDEQGPTNRGTTVPSYPPPSSRFQWVVPWMCPLVVLSASITLGPLIRALLSTHWWDFSVPLGGGLRLEQLEPARASCPRLGRRPQSAEYAERISSGVRVANVKQMIYVIICFAS